jgi:Pyruvate/2-oxoacid:ferredoxin oxidoreductase delta subunit
VEPLKGSPSESARKACQGQAPNDGEKCFSNLTTTDRTSPVLGPVKIELIEDVIVDEQEHAKDLSIRGQQLQQRPQPEVVQIHRKRPASPAVSVKLIKKSAKVCHANLPSSNNNDHHESDSNWRCQHCSITFPNQTLYFLHRGFHSETDPWRCNGCGLKCSNLVSTLYFLCN